MNKVKAIKDMEQIVRMREHLDLAHEKYVILFMIGIETGLRISDILPIRVLTALEARWEITEAKTLKGRVVVPPMALKMLIRAYVDKNSLQPEDYLIYSTNKNKGKPVTRMQAYKVMKKVSGWCGLESVGTHTMRKTFAVHHYRAHRDLEELRKILNHDKVETTLIYLTDCLE